MTSELALTTVEGPNGKAQIYEVVEAASRSSQYQVRFKRRKETFRTLGEAYITAKEKAGVKV